MKWSVQQLNTMKAKGIVIDEIVDVSDLKEVHQEIREISTVHVTGEGHFSKHTVTFTLLIKGEMTLPCSRTLANVFFPFEVNTMEIFRLYEGGNDEEAEEIHEPENNSIDLLSYVKQAILLEIPIQVFSKEQKGEAPQTGVDWELVTEERRKPQIDPRLAGLAKFFEDE